MGGTAIASVDDPSAVFHNPAGLSEVEGLELLANVTTFLVSLQTSPDHPGQHLQSGTSFAPVPFLSLGYRVSEVIALGLGFYPVGAVSGRFEYENEAGIRTLNEQFAVAMEVSPAVSLKLLTGLSVGLGYRVTTLQYDRHLGPADDPDVVDIDTFGVTQGGFRGGIQWRSEGQGVQLGLTYRHQIVLSAKADEGRLLGVEVTNVEGRLAVPGKIAGGIRVNDGALSVAVDGELALNSQFDELVIRADVPSQDTELDVPFTFNWSDSLTLKFGSEYRLDSGVALRAGYAWDQGFSNPAYPNTFMTPPSDSHYLTLGAGYTGDRFSVNFAAVQKFQEPYYIEETQIASKAECAFCGSSGLYESTLTGMFVDASVNWDL